MKRLMLFLLAIAPFVAMTAAAAEVPRTKIHTNAESSWDSGEYFYDGSGNIRAIGLERYVYDAAGRIVSGTALGPANRQSYTYDAFGNRLSATTVSAIPCAGGVDCQEAIVVNSATNRMEGSATYDEAGNVRSLGDGHSTYEYDPDGMIAKQVDGASVREYVYTADDQRIAVVAAQQWLWTVRDPAQRVLRDFSSRDGADAQWTMTQDYIYSDVTLLGTLSAAGRRHLHLDHLGTTRLVTDDASRRLAEHAYYPFGTELQLAAELPEIRMKFTGHERDTIPGEIHTLDYMHARYYAASMGRFLTIDPAMDVEKIARNPQSWNRYAYVDNSPVRFDDPDGRLKRDPMTGQLVFMVVASKVTMTHAGDGAGIGKGNAGYLFADDGRPIEAFQNVNGRTNFQCDCHGLTFADGKFFIDNSQVRNILAGDGYSSVAGPRQGDVAVYSDKSGNVVHTTTVVSVDKKGNVMVAGLGGLQMKSQTTSAKAAWPEKGTKISYYRRDNDSRTEAERKRHVEEIQKYEKRSY
jgi:RHS repeat-associated protein